MAILSPPSTPTFHRHSPSPSPSPSPYLSPSQNPSSFLQFHQSLPASFKFDPSLTNTLISKRLPKSPSSPLAVASYTDCAAHRHPLSTGFVGIRKTCYSVLGVPQNASQKDIRSAYRQLALQFHPDLAPLHQLDTTTKLFSDINEAYATLSDPEKRNRYDLKLALEAPASVGAGYGTTRKYTDMSTGRTYSSISSFYREWKGNKQSSWETDQCWC